MNNVNNHFERAPLPIEVWNIYAIYREWGYFKEGKKYLSNEKSKRNLRSVNQWKIALSDDFGYTLKRFFPKKLTTTEIETLYQEETLINFSPWDCTGKPFTRWIKIFNIPGGTWVYHSIGYDI